MEDLIRTSLKGASSEEVDAKEAVQMRFSQGKELEGPTMREMPGPSGPQGDVL